MPGSLITQDEARNLVLEMSVHRRSDQLGTLSVDPKLIASGEYGWVFSCAYLEPDGRKVVMLGNCPILVERRTGKAHVLGYQAPLGFYVANFERFGDPHRTSCKGRAILFKSEAIFFVKNVTALFGALWWRLFENRSR